MASTPSSSAPARACQWRPPAKRSSPASLSKKPPAHSTSGNAAAAAAPVIPSRRWSRGSIVSSQPRRPAAHPSENSTMYCGNIASCRWICSDPIGNTEVHGERAGRDRHCHASDLTAAQPTPYGRGRLGPNHSKEHIAEREGEQRLEEPGRPGREMPDLLPHERPERLAPAVVLAVRDVLEHRADQERVRHQRHAQPDQPILHEPVRPLAIERRRRQPAGDQEEQAQREQPAGSEQDGDGSHDAARHLLVGLEVPRSVEPVGDRAVQRDDADDEQHLDGVEVGQP